MITTNKFDITLPVNITNAVIEVIMSEAKEACAHWCKVVPEEGNGYRLECHEDIIYHILTQDKILEGIKKYLENPTAGDFLEVVDHELHVDTNYLEEEEVDAIIQYAVMGKIFYERP